MSLLSIFNMIDPVILLVNLMITLAMYVFKYIKSKCRRDPRMVEFAKTLPGPRGFPLIGSSMDFYQKGDTLKLMLEYREKYGDMYRLWIGKYLAVGLSNIDDLENVFMNSKMLGKPKIFKPFEDFFGDGLFTTYSIPQWRKNRKLFQPLFNHSALHNYTSAMNDKINNVVNKMKHLVDGPEFDAWDYLPYLSFDIILKTAMNVDLNWDDKLALQYHVAITKATLICFRKICLPWLQYKLIDNLFYKKQSQAFRREVVEFLQKLIRDKKEEIKHQIEAHKNKTDNVEDIPPKTFLTLSYELAESEKNEKIMIDELLDILTGGTDTASIMNSFFLLAVAIHQDIQDRLYDELYEVFGDSDRLADENDMSRLPYLDQVLKETLRRFPIVPLMFREAEEDTKLRDRVIPTGTIIIISVAAVHFNPNYYPEPWKFNPENFSPEAVEKRHKLAFLAFSAGLRNCVGTGTYHHIRKTDLTTQILVL
ncbi:cytochrome P450 4C1-like isoform X2 [Planococcus citri]|uniref:cytochrome P450 4C1-like isoform X2 n=1 Tax=Planococcus citri TaxID=170843 RepID=UPI0031F9966C